MTTINKNFFIAPSTTGLGAMRWVAMLLLAVMMLTTAQTAWATDKTLSGSDNYTAQDGDVLTGSTSGTVTIAGNANITLNNSTINGGIVCEGSATITLVGTNSVTGINYKSAGIQIGGSGTTLTIKGDGSLTATGGNQSAGIGLSRIFNYDNNVSSGDIIIEGGTITAIGGNQGAGIGTGIIKNTNNDNSTSVQFGNVTIKGGTVTATDGGSGDGIGKGYSYSGPSITFGIVTIYDGINMVDASSIKNSESIVYMHDAEDVTATASNYFTITEDGDHRVIVPKDDTDYIITIADDIEHGTLTVAATAKYMEKVTITATPDLGYRLSRLVVKDADNNDVATTGNSFLMPKGGVTVSAVFEQGTHGTTEFAWVYAGPEGYVTDATIYDGVTTVNFQQDRSYKILKYNEYSYSKFLLDNNTSYVTIPYSGGTGTFSEYVTGTSFKVDDNGEEGFYDITMTDVGNGKWSVSILKTVGVIDNIPDQTYTGSEITPEPLVMAGSLSLTKGTDYVYSYENNENVGTATVRATFQGTYSSLGYVEKEFSIQTSTVMVSVTGSGTVTCGDRSATDGTSFGVMSEKGASVVLTLAPTDGNAVRSVEYGYTNNRGTTASGLKLPVSGTTATLTVPDDLKDGTGVTVTVTFAPALNGGADEASAVALTDATVTDLGGGWYKVENDITFDHTLNLLADTYLTIAEGKTMTVNTASGKAIDSEYTLNVSGAGALNITTAEAYKIAVRVGSYVQTGATVTASGYIGIRCMDNFDEFNVTNDFTFSGGQLTATGSGSGNGIWADNDITLGWTNPDDRITASSYDASGTVKVADGKTLWNGSETLSGTITDLTKVNGKTLMGVDILLDDDRDANVKNSQRIAAHADKTLAVTLSGCTLYKDGSWNTLCLPFDVELNATDCPLYGATARSLTAASVSGTTLNLTFGDAVNTLEAGTPYIIKWDGDGTSNIENPVFKGVTIEATKHDYDTNAESVTTDERVRFVGTYKSTAFGSENKSILLMGSENTLFYPTTGAGIGAQRAYFKIGDDDNALLARRLTAFSIDFGEGEEEVTGIVEVEANTSLSTLHSSLKDAWHTLDGRRLQDKPTQGGIYIKNGKKITVK